MSASGSRVFEAPESGFPCYWTFWPPAQPIEEILEDYPQLRRDDALAAVAYGAEMSRERFVELPGDHAA